MSQSEIFSIRQMIELTGLSEFTIRGWENRYSAFEPTRSGTGRREYSKRDVERALLLRELLKRGHKISHVARLGNRRLQSLFEKTEEGAHGQDKNTKPKLIKDAMELMALQRWTELSLLFKNVQSKRAVELVHDFLLPLLTELVVQVQSGVVSIAQEHVFSSLLKEKIYSALSKQESQIGSLKNSNMNRFVLAAPEGDHHEIGLLLAHLMIRSHGFTSLFLGAHTPSQDLSETALRFNASHVLIVSTLSKKQGARQDILGFVTEVQKKLGPNLKILLAGSQAPVIKNEPSSSLVSLASFQDFETYLQSIKNRKSRQ